LGNTVRSRLKNSDAVHKVHADVWAAVGRKGPHRLLPVTNAAQEHKTRCYPRHSCKGKTGWAQQKPPFSPARPHMCARHGNGTCVGQTANRSKGAGASTPRGDGYADV
jgi:hypothetical protein